MPKNINAATPTDVLPKFVMQALNEMVRIEALVNQDYVDGSSDRNPLVTDNGRAFFRITARVSSVHWNALRNFYIAHIGQAFYFYFPRETQPPFTVDATGAQTTGRYTVVFDGAWSETYTNPGREKADAASDLGMAQIQFQLREVE